MQLRVRCIDPTLSCKDIYISFEIEYKCRSKKNTCVEGNGTWYEGTD